jgi:hypothetical protein
LARTRSPQENASKYVTEARDFVHGLSLKNVNDWLAHCCAGQKPENIPRNPDRTYSSEQGWGDWLGARWAR